MHVIIMCKKKCRLTLETSYKTTIYYEKNVNKKTLLTYDEYYEKYNYMKVLKIACKDDLPCLIIKDTSICNNIFDELSKVTDYDLCFLASWKDECHQYVNYKDNLKWSKSCHASQAVLYSNEIKKILYHELKSKTVSEALKELCKNHKALVFIPNIVQFNIDMASSNADYEKLNCCLPVPIQDPPINTANNAAWIIFIVLFIILLAILVPYFKHHQFL